jgi:enoyl-CoA hydratase/carnithine racemase
MILCGERIDAQRALPSAWWKKSSPAAARWRGTGPGRKSCAPEPEQRRGLQDAHRWRTHAAAAHMLPLERERFVDLFDTQDQKEGVQAFLEKRTAEWRNA